MRLADLLDDRVTSRHSFGPRANYYRVNYDICEVTWWVARPGGRRRLCPEPVPALVRQPYVSHGDAAVLGDVRRSWSDGRVEHTPAGAELFHVRASQRSAKLRRMGRYHLATEEELQAFAVEAQYVLDGFAARTTLARLTGRIHGASTESPEPRLGAVIPPESPD
jgi:hypothetical protein